MDKYTETQRFALFISGADKQEQWNQKATSVSFYNLKAIVDGIIAKLNISDLVLEESTCKKLSWGMQYMRNGKQLVLREIKEFHRVYEWL